MPATDKAKVFMSGRSQAVRIPLAYRFDTDEVYIRRDERTGEVVLSPVSPKPMKSWDEIFAALDAAEIPEDFMKDREQGFPQERDEL